jgi:TPR repeat protein
VPQAQYNTGTHYFMGRGTEQDMGQAFKFFRQAAEAGMTQSMVNLAQMYEEGLGVERDPEAAQKWYAAAGVTRDETSEPSPAEPSSGGGNDISVKTAR